jgi:hypothetical protein
MMLETRGQEKNSNKIQTMKKKSFKGDVNQVLSIHKPGNEEAMDIQRIYDKGVIILDDSIHIN